MSPTLLNHVRSLVEAERALTDAIEQSTPLLQQNTMSSSILSSQSDPPLLPTPRNIEEVKTILAVARTYSLRTSAPPMWNPNLPVIGFATPNPLPHQLRGGALGAMQLKMAREEKNRKIKEAADNLRERERKEKLEEEEAITQKESEHAMDIDEVTKTGQATSTTPAEGKALDPKKEEMIGKQKRRMEQVAANGQKKQTTAEMQAKKAAANMNLSDSSSSEEDSDSE